MLYTIFIEKPIFQDGADSDRFCLSVDTILPLFDMMVYKKENSLYCAAAQINIGWAPCVEFKMASAIRSILVDLSGTIHVENKVIPGSIEAIKRQNHTLEVSLI